MNLPFFPEKLIYLVGFPIFIPVEGGFYFSKCIFFLKSKPGDCLNKKLLECVYQFSFLRCILR